MMKYLISCMFLLCVVFSYSQQQVIDSMLIQAAAQKMGTQESITSFTILKDAFSNSKDKSNNYRLYEISTALGDYFFGYEMYDDAIKYYKSYLESDEKSRLDKEAKKDVIEKIGRSFSSLGKPDSAYFYYQTIEDEVIYPEKIEVLNDLVHIFAANNNIRKSLEFNKQIEVLLLKNDGSKNDIAKIYNNIGHNYHHLKDYVLSIEYFKKSLITNPAINDSEKSTINRNLGISYSNLGEYDEAEKYLKKSIKQQKEENTLAELHQLLSEVYIYQPNFYDALIQLEKAEELVVGSDNDLLKTEIFSSFSNAYYSIHEYDLAFDYFQKYYQINDSIKFVNKLAERRTLDSQKYIERTEKEARLLKAQKEFQALKIEQLQIQARNQRLQFEALRKDSIQRRSELAIARQQNEISKSIEENNALLIASQKNQLQLSNQKLEIAKANEINAEIERQKRQKEIELAKQTIDLEKQNAQLLKEKAANKAKETEIQLSRIKQRNVGIMAGLLGLLAVFFILGYRRKQRDNLRLNLAQDKLKAAEEKITGLLKQQVSEAVAEALMEDNDPSAVHKKFVSVMFIDIRNFTVFCEGKKPDEIIEYQNSIFGFMMDIIEKKHGIVNQLMGDGFMATFGAPTSHENDTLNAYEASKEILEMLDAKVKAKEVVETRIGIGLHSGYVVTGNVGNEERKQYSITGNTVILAARLEQLNKEYKSSFIYSREVYDALPPNVQDNVTFESVVVKGRTKPIDIAVFP